jgi:hypothetical protein
VSDGGQGGLNIHCLLIEAVVIEDIHCLLIEAVVIEDIHCLLIEAVLIEDIHCLLVEAVLIEDIHCLLIEAVLIEAQLPPSLLLTPACCIEAINKQCMLGVVLRSRRWRPACLRLPYSTRSAPWPPASACKPASVSTRLLQARPVSTASPGADALHRADG